MGSSICFLWLQSVWNSCFLFLFYYFYYFSCKTVGYLVARCRVRLPSRNNFEFWITIIKKKKKINNNGKLFIKVTTKRSALKRKKVFIY